MERWMEKLEETKVKLRVAIKTVIAAVALTVL